MRAVFAVVLLAAAFSVAQARAVPADTTLGDVLTHDLSRAGSDVARIVTAPLHFSTGDWMVAAGVVGTTAVLFSLDRTARSTAARNHSEAADGVFRVGREYGREMYGLSLAGGLYAGGLLFRSEQTRTTGRMLFESVAIAGVVNMALKSVIGRSRPQTEEGPFRFRGLQSSLEHTSLPSGHSTVAFSVSSVLSRRIGNPYASAGLYALAGVTAVSRVYHDNHWFSDTFLGAALGTAVGLSVSSGEGESGLSVEPSASGVRLSYRF